ncbi:MAG TPA: glycoside hydrolase [Gammaproteobacteria bacterium]|nr:glycoside hydrolase [Gammaproteobacteria bacterium]
MKARFFTTIILFAVAASAVPSARAEITRPIEISRASHLLTGPWRFHVGDDAHWAAPDFDDSHWETADLTPAPGAHDGDVGLMNYVSGWWARGHDGYSGYAWYRTHISVDVPAGTPIALLAPAYVEDAYQLFWNGTLIGGSGDFSGKTPVIYSTKPQIFRLPPEAANADDAVVAIRVWMRPGLARTPDAGGIHIAPMLGTTDAINAQYRLQWLQTVKGYVVEVAEPLAFVLLAIFAWCFRATLSPGRFVPWLCAALLLTAAYRLNQAAYYWTPYESLSVYLAVHRALIPLGLAAWIMAWRHWYQLERWRWLTYAIGIITLLSVVLVLTLPHDTFAVVNPILRVPLAVVLLVSAVAGLRKRGPDRLLTFIVVLFVAVSQFSGELAALGVPYIWFPFGTGVSLTQYAYAGIIVGLATLLVRRVQRVAASRFTPDLTRQVLQ